MPALGAPNLSDLELMINPGDEEVDVRLERGETFSLLVETLSKDPVVSGVGDSGELGLREIVDEIRRKDVAVRHGPGDPLQGE